MRRTICIGLLATLSFASCFGLLMVLLSACFSLVWADEPEESFAVLNQDAEEVFIVNDRGDVAADGVLLTNGAGPWGDAPFVLGQDPLNRGIVITDKAPENPKNIYFGWNVGATHEYAEIFALQEGIAYMDLILNPGGSGFVGIRTTTPSHPLEMGSGAYVSAGGVWTNASSRNYKTDIRELTAKEAADALVQLRPVEFAYKIERNEKHVGFIAEEAPPLLATEDRKGMSSMDVVAVLTKVVQEQQKTVQEQRALIAELSERLEAVEKSSN